MEEEGRIPSGQLDVLPFNVWTFLDKNYTDCVSRLQVGSSSPLKNTKTARLKHSEKVRFGSCSMDIIDVRQPGTRPTDDEGIHIYAIAHAKSHIISVTCKFVSSYNRKLADEDGCPKIAGLAIAGVLALLLSIFFCYMRSRPVGVHKTNEGECCPSRSEEPLVNGMPAGGKEYFC
ncbi:unnamed protein product [Cylicocyclus nassatus]|uniref:Uncharacterized protein n=1 Tax=Cylicocyclus nassatus TaxID=53992 RepID=A0AA36MA44_CYLNA|nr:unnamed protein product [Cylicocyclus nassatus]